LDPDLVAALSALAERRPVFHSERDFQHSLAWQIQLSCPEAQIRLEPRPRRGIHLDLLVRVGERRMLGLWFGSFCNALLPVGSWQAASEQTNPHGH